MVFLLVTTGLGASSTTAAATSSSSLKAAPFYKKRKEWLQSRPSPKYDAMLEECFASYLPFLLLSLWLRLLLLNLLFFHLILTPEKKVQRWSFETNLLYNNTTVSIMKYYSLFIFALPLFFRNRNFSLRHFNIIITVDKEGNYALY